MAEQSSAPDAGESATDGVEVDAESGDGGLRDVPGESPRVVGLDSADAEDVLGAVSSDTAREVLAALQEDPAPASELADRVERSLQTVQYHVGNLEEAGLVEAVDTATSEKGREMAVYGAARQPVVVYAGDDGGDDLREALSRLVSGVAFLALVSLLVQELVGGGVDALSGSSEVTMDTASRGFAEGAASGPEPGVVFFAGGLAVLVVALAVRYLRPGGYLDGTAPWR